MRKKVKQFAEIFSGYSFRSSIENDSNGDVFVFQAKNIQTFQDIKDVSDLIKISDQTLRSPIFLKKKDVLLVSRGFGVGTFRSCIFLSEEERVMPSSSVLVIRPKADDVISKYLSLYLNSELGQKSLIQIVTGSSYIQSLLIKNLNELEIKIPSIQIQKTIIALQQNLIEQENLLKRKQELNKSIFNSIFTNF